MQAGGIAAVSNFGTFGVEWGTPIPLPDQTMILGLGVGKKVPEWDDTKKEFVPKQSRLRLRLGCGRAIAFHFAALGFRTFKQASWTLPFPLLCRLEVTAI